MADMDVLYTAGHSTRTLDELAALLEEAGVTAVADVRRFPASRRHPHFERGRLELGLAGRSIVYRFLGDSLGGRRNHGLPIDESPNRAWQVDAFRHYADAMSSGELSSGVAALEALGRSQPTAFLCAERPWWKCHRRLLADLLVVRGWRVVHLLEPGRQETHRLSEWARVEDGRLTYPALV